MNFRFMFFLLLLVFCSILSGCSMMPFGKKMPVSVVDVVETPTTMDRQKSTEVKTILLKQYKEWQNTPHKIGGLSKRGIDCSGFTLVTFQSKFGYTLPRTTKLQAQTGKKIARKNIQAGDLVFFKPSIFYNHVGIYMGNSEFLHASSSRGVMISNITESYWRNSYWTARRISY